MRNEIKLGLAVTILMIACCASASDTIVNFNLGVFPVKFDLGAPCDVNISAPIKEESLSGPQDTYLAKACNDSIYFIIVHLYNTNFDTIPYLGTEGITQALLNFGANEDSINVSPIIINGKPGVIGSAYIPANNPPKYQARYQNLLSSGMPPHVKVLERCIPCSSGSRATQIYSGYIHANNSIEYQARFPLTNNDFGILGTSGNETKMKSLLKSITVAIPQSKESPFHCEQFDFGIGDFAGVEGEICPNGMFSYHKKIIGIATEGKSFNLAETKFCPIDTEFPFVGNETQCFDFNKKGLCLYYNISRNGKIVEHHKVICLKN